MIEQPKGQNPEHWEDGLTTDFNERRCVELHGRDSLDSRSGKGNGRIGLQQGANWAVILQLALQRNLAVYEDIDTPCSMYIQENDIKHRDDILVLHGKFTLLPLVKYVVIISRANDCDLGPISYHVPHSLLKYSPPPRGPPPPPPLINTPPPPFSPSLSPFSSPPPLSRNNSYLEFRLLDYSS
ncbi:hypothetical protein AKJ16_DCAP24234 [Drosera capensis]